MKIVYIAAVGHSGSTILDMSFGCAKHVVGLGEIDCILRATKEELASSTRFNDARCSCGAAIAKCEFWENARSVLQDSKANGEFEKYNEIIKYFKNHYGDNSVLVDSSKNPHEYLIKLDKSHDLRIIFLIRDVRSWTYSRYSRHGTNRLKFVLQWYRGNRRLLKFLTENRLNFKIFGYEEYALYPEYMLKKMCEFTDIVFNDDMLTPGLSQSHILNGNVAKGDDEKRQGILYDARWMTDNSMVLSSPLVYPILNFNRNYVYSNFVTRQTAAFGVKQSDFLFFGDSKKEELMRQGWGSD